MNINNRKFEYFLTYLKIKFPLNVSDIQKIFNLMLQNISYENAEIIIDNYAETQKKNQFIKSITSETITDDMLKNILRVFINSDDTINFSQLKNFLNVLKPNIGFDNIENYLKKKSKKEIPNLDDLVEIIKNLNG